MIRLATALSLALIGLAIAVSEASATGLTVVEPGEAVVQDAPPDRAVKFVATYRAGEYFHRYTGLTAKCDHEQFVRKQTPSGVDVRTRISGKERARVANHGELPVWAQFVTTAKPCEA